MFQYNGLSGLLSMLHYDLSSEVRLARMNDPRWISDKELQKSGSKG